TDDSSGGSVEDNDGVEDEDATPPSQPDLRTYRVLSDFKGEQEGDLTVKKGEVLKIIRKTTDGWWLAQNTGGNTGVVPKTFLKVSTLFEICNIISCHFSSRFVQSELSFSLARVSPHSNWSTVRKAMTEIDATDVLAAMGAIPSGFRPSTLNKLLTEEGSHHIQPELCQSQLSFKDLFLDPDTGRVRPRHVRVSICFTLWSCKQIPTPGVGVQVLSRHIHLCAFDGTQVLSNIHTVRATYNSKNSKTWSFSPRMTGVLPTLLDGDCFLRCNSSLTDLGILFELGITFIRNSTGERGDLSCGWAFLKLTDDSGNLLPNRTYELPVPNEQMLQSRRQPKLIIKLRSADSRTRTQLSQLPDTLLHCLSCVQLLALHRQLLADALLMDRPTMQTADLMCCPILATFPSLLDQLDLLDALRSAWMDVERSMSRAQKRDFFHVKQEFHRVYMSSVYFLLHTAELPRYRWADPPTEEQRSRVIFTTLDSLKLKPPNNGPVGGAEVYLSSDHEHLAFDVSELTFDLLSVAK
uniref:Nephronophthisis 1 n=1 Tax=Neogobius melanostomus TaxID=47308 RepID=A0A8C6UHI1_9GOBI